MRVNRRSAIKQLFLISAGAALLPSCINDKKPASYAFSHLPITAKEEEILAGIAATIIPATDTPGAKEVGHTLLRYAC